MKTTPRSRMRIAFYVAAVGWLLLFLAVDRPDSGRSWSFAHAGLAIGATGTVLTAAVTLWTLAAFREHAAYASVWLGAAAAAVLFDWVAFQADASSYGMSGLLSLGAPPDPARDAVGNVVSIAGWIGLAAAVLAITVWVASRTKKTASRRPLSSD